MRQLLAGLFAWLCIGTLLAQAAWFGYLWYSGKLDRGKMFHILAVVHGVAVEQATPAPSAAAAQAEVVSFEDIERARKLRARDLELKAQSLQKGLEQLGFEREELAKDRQRYVLLQESFEERLKELQEETEAKGYANVRLVLENINPKKAKEQIMKMVEAGETEDVVHLLAEMPIGKRAKIVSQFATDDEQEVLDKLLRQIRKGGAVSALIDEARQDATLQ